MKNVVIGTGSALPKKVVTNATLAKQVDTTDEWITTRTGIKQRHICEEGETTASLATLAAKRAIDAAGISVDDIDFVIVATASPDLSFPSVANLVQRNLGISGPAGFDIQAACSGFIYALNTAHNALQVGQARNALVIAADTFSNFLDWNDRSTCVLFGDGAGAVVLQAQENENDRGIIGVDIFADGAFVDELKSTGGVATTRTAGHVHMNGREVFKHAVRAMGNVVPHTLEKYNLREDEIDWLVPHQANQRIIEATAKMLNMPMTRVVMCVDQHANTSAASIPLALDSAVKSGQIKTGDVLFLEAFGAGFTWGSALLKW